MTETFRLFHVGGRTGGIGPSECLLQLGKNLELSVFEADIGGDEPSKAFDKDMDNYTNRYKIKSRVIAQCLYNCVGEKKFNVNVMPESSSLLRMSPDAVNYGRMHGERVISWGKDCQPARTVEVHVTTLDELYKNNMIQLPHFLSIDAQGAEYEIMEGASKALDGDLVGVLSEVEFRELYEGQKLFTDQFTLLRGHHFNLFDLYSVEYWYTSYIVGKGALMVAEALFLRDFNYFIGKESLLPNLSRLAIAAHVFGKTDYSFQIMEYIMSNFRHEWEVYIEQSNASYLYGLMEFYWQIKRQIPDLPGDSGARK